MMQWASFSRWQWCALSLTLALFLATTLFYARASRAQDADDDLTSEAEAAPGDDLTEDAAEADGDVPRRRLIRWNEYDGPYLSARLGGGLLFDAVTYAQDGDSENQMRLLPKVKLRDFRLLLKGQIKPIPGLSYTPVAPAPTAVVIHAQKGQSQAQQNRDNKDCQSAASAQALSSHEWAQLFASCMGARGYLVQ